MEVTMPTYYGDVDAEYLQRTAELVQQPKQRTYELMHIQPGSKVVDVGCGPGTDTIALAHLVGPTGQVVGIDFNATFLAQADERADQAGVRTWVTHQHADATNLPFEANTFDACRSERLLQHLPHPEQAVAEMVRITRPGGWLVIADADWGTLSIDTSEIAIERRLVRLEADMHTIARSKKIEPLVRAPSTRNDEKTLLPLQAISGSVLRQSPAPSTQPFERRPCAISP